MPARRNGKFHNKRRHSTTNITEKYNVYVSFSGVTSITSKPGDTTCCYNITNVVSLPT